MTDYPDGRKLTVEAGGSGVAARPPTSRSFNCDLGVISAKVLNLPGEGYSREEIIS